MPRKLVVAKKIPLKKEDEEEENPGKFWERGSEDRVREVHKQDGWWLKKWAPISAISKKTIKLNFNI